jgi:uncharacterized protein YndB with AHSA1/START domain
MAALESVLPPAEQDLVITRLFDAPPELVFRLWTDPVHAMRWWGPRDYPLTRIEMDVRPGGLWRGCLTSVEDGEDLWQGGKLLEIDPPRRLVFTFAWEADGERGIETVVSLDFVPEGGKTRMHFRQTPFQSIAERDGHNGGWSSCFDRLDDFLAEVQRG